MKIINVLPIGNAVPKGTFDYFIKDDVKIGELVEIEFKGRKIKGKILKIENALENKESIKSSVFSLKKAKKIKDGSFQEINDLYLASEKTSAHFLTSLGETIEYFSLPKDVKDILRNFKSEKKIKKVNNSEIFAIQDNFEERMSLIRQEIRSVLAKNLSVFVFAPTIEESFVIFENLKKGIENKSFLLLNDKKKINEVIKDIFSQKSCLFVSIPSFCLFLEMKDFGLIIIEKEGSKIYKNNLKKPFLDFRFFIKEYAKISKTNLIFADKLLRFETIIEIENSSIQELRPIKKSFRWQNEIIEINEQKEEIRETKTKKEKTALLELIKENKQKLGKIFIFSPRRGLVTKTFCGDCGKIISCQKCKNALFLHRREEKENYFFCHNCNSKQDAKTLCENCGSWNLKTFGIGSEELFKTLKENFKDTEIYIVDKDTKLSEKKIKEIVKDFLEKENTILIGTETALKFLESEKIDSVVIWNSSFLFSIPDFRNFENGIRLIIRLRDLSSRYFILNKEEIPKNIINFLEHGNISEIIEEEKNNRQRFGYSPFKTIIKIEKNIKKEEITKNEKIIKEILLEKDINILEQENSGNKNKPILFKVILKIEERELEKKEMQEKFEKLKDVGFSLETEPSQNF